MLDRGEDDDWLSSPFIRVMAVLAVLGIVGAIVLAARWRNSRSCNLDVLKDRNFAVGCIMIAAMAACSIPAPW